MAYNYPYFNANYTPPAAPQMAPPAPMFGGMSFGQPAAQSNVSWVYDMREKSKAASDWCKEMAVAHLTFNTGGAALAKKLMDEAKANDPSERMEGRLEVWSERHAEIAREGAEIRAMLECLK